MAEAGSSDKRGSRGVDELDRALVERLREDGRESNRSLAAALGVNEVTVATRLRRLESESIVRVVALTDLEAFGHSFLAFAKLRVRGHPVPEVGAELSKLPEAISVTVTTGRFDLVVAVMARERRHLLETIGSSIPRVAGVDDVACELALQVLRYDSMWALLSAPAWPLEQSDAGDAVDELDLSIIRQLQEDARGSNRRIAAELGVSEGTVRSRIRRMEDEGLIRIQAISDVLAFGMGAHAYVGINVDGGRVREVAESLLGCDAIAVLARSLGDYDFLAVVQAESREALVDMILNRIGAMQGVRRTDTFEGWRTLKHSYLWARLV